MAYLPLPLRKRELNFPLNNVAMDVQEWTAVPLRQAQSIGYLVVWLEQDSLNKWGIAGTMCNDSLRPTSSRIVFVKNDSTQYNYINHPAIIQRQNGNVLIAWEKDTANYCANIFFQEFTAERSAIGTALRANDKLANSASEVSMSTGTDGNVVIVWEEGVNLSGQRFSSTNEKIGSNYRVNTSLSGDNIYPCVKTRNGKTYTAWTRILGGVSSVWMNIPDYNNPSVGVSKTIIVPAFFSLDQNYPNPFNPATTISFSIAKRADISLKVYDCLGMAVTTLAEGLHEAGQHQAKFDASILSSGIYFYRLTADGFVLTRKMVLAK